ncbi:hypothetical protein C8R43DRAFT_960605 [Mycena crocata]|nr:hypothetical protein C8R43DRAFT_960605 [Mycena crocata]
MYMSGAERQSMERRRAPSWPCEGWTDWGDASTDGMEGAKLAMRGMDGLGRCVDGWDGGRQVGHARYEGTQGTMGWRTFGGYLPRSRSNFLSALPTYGLWWLSPSFSLQPLERLRRTRRFGAKGLRFLFPWPLEVRFDSTRTTMFEETLPTYPSSDEHSRGTLARFNNNNTTARGPGHTSSALSNLMIMIMQTRATFFLDFHHPSHYKNPPHRLLLGVAVLQDPGCGRVAQMARIPVISLCWAFSSFSVSQGENTFALFRTILLGVPVPQSASATSNPHLPRESGPYARTVLKSNCFTRLVHVRWTALGRLRAIMILNMCIASGSAYALASDGNVQAPGFQWTDQSSIVAPSRTRRTSIFSSKKPRDERAFKTS